MNERQAEQAGYEFTGIYVRSIEKEKAKARAAELREKGNRAVTVYTPDSPLSRGGGGGGYSVYWIESDDNKAARLEGERLSRINGLLAERSRLMDKVKEIDAKVEELGGKR